MKVKNEAYLRSPILRQNLKNSSDPSEKNLYSIVPSITYIWTHKPLWRRRHKNRKKLNSHRFPLSSINSRINDIDLWNVLKSTDSRLCSRSSTSPYETCSSRPVVNESISQSNNRFQKNLERFSFNQRKQSFERKFAISETRSDSGLRRSRTTQIQTIRSQKRLTLRNSSNSQNILGTRSSLEINKSIQLSVTGGTISDIGIPKRHVTFSDYVSKSSVTDTKSQINMMINDNDDDDNDDDFRASCWQSSYDRLTDNDENLLQADLSCLFSSMIFDDSQSSFFSTKSENLSENSKIIKKLNESSSTIGCSKSIFYFNAMYSNESSCNLESLPVEIGNDNDQEIESPRQKNHDDDDFLKVNEFREKKSDWKKIEKFSETEVIREINTDFIPSRSIDCITVELKNISSTIKEVLIESGDLEKQKHESLSKKQKTKNKNDIADLKNVSSFTAIADFLSINNNDMNNGNFKVDRIFEFFHQPKNRMDTDFLSQPKNRINTDLFLQPKNRINTDLFLQPKNRINTDYFRQSKNLIDNDCLRHSKHQIVTDILRQPKKLKNTDFFRPSKNRIETDFSRQSKNETNTDIYCQPKNRIDTDFLLKELSKVGAETFKNFNKGKNEEIYGIRESEIVRNSRKEIIKNAKRLRIDMETYGDRESIFIEMKNFADYVDDNKTLKELSSLRINNSLIEDFESIVINLVEVKKNSEFIDLSTSNFHNDHEKSPTLNKSCVICGRTKTENPRYLRPVCQVKGVTPSSRSDNDPWINVMNRVIQHDNSKNVLPIGMPASKNDHQSQELSKDLSNDENSTNDYSPPVRNEFKTIVERDVKECCNIINIDAENNLPSTPATIDSSIVSSKKKATSCPLEPEVSSSTSFGFTKFRGPRIQSAKTYLMKESVKNLQASKNRLLCVISESDMLMTLPPFLSKKPPDWFARQIPTRKSSRR